ncbi:hypothetical protein JCM10450v2_005309 [Rhodotorula kratochvilovae]
MSDESFNAIDALLQEEVQAVSALTQENARLRSLLAERDAALAPLDPAVMLAELQATKALQAELALELRTLREAQAAAAAVDDQVSEVAVLRASLADLAGQLEAEKLRVSSLEAQRRNEEEKVTTLRSTVEESRRALMRLQIEAAAQKRQNDAPPAVKRGSIDQNFSFPPRRRSLLAGELNLPRRRSSLGLAAIAGSPENPSSPTEEQPAPLSGLGFAVESPFAASVQLGTSPTRTSTATPLARYAHRRGSASIAVMPDDDDDAQRVNRLRELRLGVHSTKIASRRGSTISSSGLPDFVQPGEFEWDLERRFARRLSTSSRRYARSNAGDESDGDAPLSANLRLLGRKDSLAVFDSWSRRSSFADSMSNCSASTGSQRSTEQLSDLRLQLEGLKIQLAEAEEGRRASEACLSALRTYISRSDERKELPLSLPPLPSDPSADLLGDDSPSVAHCPPAPRQGSRWSIPRLSFSTPRRESGTAYDPSRRPSTASTASCTTFDNRATPSLPSFGAFSFSALVSRSAATIETETSPRMAHAPTLESFPVEPSPLLRSSSSSSIGRTSGHSPSTSIDDGASLADSVAPSLVSDLGSSACSAASSRSSSPVHGACALPSLGLGMDGSPRVTIDLAAEEASAHPFALADDLELAFAGSADERDAVVAAARMPMVKGSLVAMSSAVKAQRA